ncbi:hypothetical protein LUZ61_009568 [Rhynchospora tenuis]|uniref:NB-ARC domain-containing protein n=1 Tax=Rhynchospora tenuis TaxID=198213 RepID=A0AAD5ZXS2_9POAL|nr:hypothetical protein LUZ61_009568 [Rhynchospora tenuis]
MGVKISTLVGVVGEKAADIIVSGVASPFISRFQMQQDLDVTLNMIQDHLLKLNAAFLEARERRITNPKLLDWWAKLIADSYCGDYYHRTIKHRNSPPESEDTDSFTNRAAKRRRINNSIRTLLFGDEEMQNLYDVLKRLQAIDVHSFLQMVYAQPRRPMRTYLYMDPERLFGRDKEIQQVMNFLLKPIQAGENNVSILPIVGPWHRGKTSLSLRCFSDSKVEDHFSLKMYIKFESIYIEFARSYICCPDCCFIVGISKEIQKQCKSRETESWETNYDDFGTLLAMLKQNLSSERFLLVLNNVYNVDPMAWNGLWECLNCGKQGSKVIFVSDIFDFEEYRNKVHFGRYQKEIVCPSEMPVMIGSFSEDEYLQFFYEHALGGADPDDYPKLKEMGRKMAKKMNGSIWAVTILGEILRDNLNAQFWSKFLQALEDSWAINIPEYSDLTIDVLCRLLPGHLRSSSFSVLWHPLDCEVKTFREVMVLGPDHCRPLIKEGRFHGVKFWVRGLGFLDKCYYVKVVCKPSRVKKIAG